MTEKAVCAVEYAMMGLAALAGGTVAERGVYPGWQYKRESQFRDTLLAAYKDLTGKDGVVEATHGGLECGLLMVTANGTAVTIED